MKDDFATGEEWSLANCSNLPWKKWVFRPERATVGNGSGR